MAVLKNLLPLRKRLKKRGLQLQLLKLDVTNPTANEDEKKEENTANKKELEYLNNITKETHKGYFIYVSGAKKDEILKILKQRVK